MKRNLDIFTRQQITVCTRAGKLTVPIGEMGSVLKENSFLMVTIEPGRVFSKGKLLKCPFQLGRGRSNRRSAPRPARWGPPSVSSQGLGSRGTTGAGWSKGEGGPSQEDTVPGTVQLTTLRPDRPGLSDGNDSLISPKKQQQKRKTTKALMPFSLNPEKKKKKKKRRNFHSM